MVEKYRNSILHGSASGLSTLNVNFIQKFFSLNCSSLWMQQLPSQKMQTAPKLPWVFPLPFYSSFPFALLGTVSLSLSLFLRFLAWAWWDYFGRAHSPAICGANSRWLFSFLFSLPFQMGMAKCYIRRQGEKEWVLEWVGLEKHLNELSSQLLIWFFFIFGWDICMSTVL